MIRINQLSDIHFYEDPRKELLKINTDRSFQDVVALMKTQDWPVDAVFATGDLSQDASDVSYARVKEKLSALGAPVYCLPGNHDKAEMVYSKFNSGSVRSDRAFGIGNWRFVFLDSTIPNDTGGRFSTKELDFLSAELSLHAEEPTLIAFHHQPQPVGSAWLDRMQIENGKEFFKIIDRFPQVKAVIWGHIHQEFDAVRNGVRLLAAPSTGLQFKPHSAQFQADTLSPGYRWLHLNDNGTLVSGVRRISKTYQPDLTAKGY